MKKKIAILLIVLLPCISGGAQKITIYYQNCMFGSCSHTISINDPDLYFKKEKCRRFTFFNVRYEDVSLNFKIDNAVLTVIDSLHIVLYEGSQSQLYYNLIKINPENRTDIANSGVYVSGKWAPETSFVNLLTTKSKFDTLLTLIRRSKTNMLSSKIVKNKNNERNKIER